VGNEFNFGKVELLADPRTTPLTLELVGGPGLSFTAPGDAEPIRFHATSSGGAPAADVELDLCVDDTYLTFVYPPNSVTSRCANLRTDFAGFAATPRVRTPFIFGRYKFYVHAFDPVAAAFVELRVDVANVSEPGVADVSVQGMWWGGPSQNGWGLSLVQHAGIFFGVLFAYDAAGQPIWYVIPSGRWRDRIIGRAIDGTLYTTRGSPYFAYDPSRLVVSDPRHNYNPYNLDFPYDVDSLGIFFLGANKASFGAFLYGREPIRTFNGAIVPQDFSSETPSPITGLGDMWWGGPSQNGWGVSIHEQRGGLFSVWFTYDASGAPTWFFMPDGRWTDSRTYAGDVYRTTGSPLGLPGQPYDASILQVQKIGTYRFVFSDTRNATMHYDVEGHTGTNALTRQDF
jgi:hypothetical protein